MKTNTLFDENNRATYCPEDDKIRLYVGRVPRDEYEALRAEGWTSTPKQDCDFAAVWTPSREDTALAYAGIIEDEDAGPDERAADRAERFGGYLDKRLDEATGNADRYDAGPSAHGFQSKARAVRAADRHDRQASRAVNAWDKAEYWQQRTAGVISHALYKSRPDVRMGRIKTLESELRKAEASLEERRRDYALTVKISQDPAGYVSALMSKNPGRFDTPEQAARSLAENLFGYWWKLPGTDDSPWKAMDPEAENPLTLAEVCEAWLACHSEPPTLEEGTRTIRHLRLRIAYENQMLEAQGGRAASLEMVKGGSLGGRTIAKVNKSAKTGRVVSVAVIGPATGERWTHGAANEPGTPFALYSIDTERLAPGAYSEPTPESLAKLAEFEAAKKAAAKAKPAAPALINPTEADAERLQALWNARAFETAPEYERKEWTNAEPLRITQAQYSANSGGTYSSLETAEICAEGVRAPRFSNLWTSRAAAEAKKRGPVLCKVRLRESSSSYGPPRVVIITDKPAKPLPAAVWQPITGLPTPDSLKPRARELVRAVNARPRTPEQQELTEAGQIAGLVGDEHMTEAGHAWARELGAYSAAV